MWPLERTQGKKLTTDGGHSTITIAHRKEGLHKYTTVRRHLCIKCFPRDKMFDSKLKAFADYKLKFSRMFGFAFGRLENVMRKGENTVYQHFLLLPHYFQKASLQRIVKPRFVWKTVNQ